MQAQRPFDSFASLMRGGPSAWWNALRNVRRADFGWFVLVTGLLAVSPITGAGRPLAAAVLGLVGGVGLLLIRLLLRAIEPPRPRHYTFATPALSVWLLVVAVAALMAPTFGWLYVQYIESIWRNPHGLFVAFFAVLLIRHRLRADTDTRADASPWGFAFLAVGAALVVLDAGMRSHYAAVVGFLLIIPGLLLLLFGARRTRALAFPIAFCFFLMPVPDGMSDPLYLPTFSSEIGTSLVRAIGIPVTRVGTRIALDTGGGIEVTQNCSGLSAFYSGCALSFLCLGFTQPWWRRVGIVLAPYLFTAVANGIRIALLIWIGKNYGLDWKFDTPLHGILGTLAYLAVMVGIWLLADKRRLREGLA
ncbi:MAG: exosortase/archaeosortase family protein [Myxococcota bacterium]|nr:exosortase/archaeosortase family protein [Myxococcota bacterium]